MPDKFTWGGDFNRSNVIQCLTCRHRVKGVHPIACDAFPGGVPDAILRNQHDHRQPYPGDHGILYEPDDAAPFTPIRKVKEPTE